MPTNDLTINDVFGGYKVYDECYVAYLEGYDSLDIDNLVRKPRKGIILSRNYADGYFSTSFYVDFDIVSDGEIINCNINDTYKTLEECKAACNAYNKSATGEVE